MNVVQPFEMLGRRQLAIQDGIDLLNQIRIELSRTRASADAWGMAAVMANVTLIPLNIIVNALELKAANTAYQVLVRQLYGKFGKSGTRLDGHAKTALSLLKQAILEELKRKAITEFVPGVNMLVGLAEDSLAAWQAIQMVESGSHQISLRARDLEVKILMANRQLLELGIKRAALLERLQISARTA